jgi:3-deoxy-D-manno-octulosonic-acid transferase
MRFHASQRRRHSGRGDVVMLVDTVGELAALYASADVAFVGGVWCPSAAIICWSRPRWVCRC